MRDFVSRPALVSLVWNVSYFAALLREQHFGAELGRRKMGAVLQFLPFLFLVVLCPPVLSLRQCTRLFFVFILLFDCGLLRGVDVLSWHRSTGR